MGGSQTKSNYYVSHSVGQSSVVGASQLNSSLVSQGYQQPVFNAYILQPTSNSNEIKFYPNPFSTELIFELSIDYDNIQITIIDINGRIVFKNIISSANQTILINVPSLSEGEYIFSLTAHNLYYQTKIIKKL